MKENQQELQKIGTTVLVTGATGFAGANIIRELLKRGYRVYAVTRDEEKLRRLVSTDCIDRITILKGDLLVDADLATLEKHLRDIDKLDVVVQTVGGGPLTCNPAFAQGIFDLNHKTTSNLVTILQRSQKLQALRLFVYYSSLAAMGLPSTEADQIVYNESSACNPVLPYERAKHETEIFLQGLADKHGLKTVILRFPQIYGGPDDAFLQMVSLMRKKVFPVVRGKVGSLPLVHIRDVVGATLAVIRNVDAIRENYNVHLICEGSYSYDRLADLVKEKYSQGGMIRIPYALLYLATLLAEIIFRIARKPEPLNRRRLLSLTKDRIVDSSKFVNTFGFKFEERVQDFIAAQPS